MLFFSFFKTLVDQEVTVELKNDIEIKGTLKSVDQYLNLKLDNISGINETKYPHLSAIKNLFIRGSTVRYVHMDPRSVDCTLLQDASRRGKFLFLFITMASYSLPRDKKVRRTNYITEAVAQSSK
ncbi:Piso0_004929 [Millerozyma farinosa CBS 7064]|uniref:Piso0_004929 protein n=1 Tax=Pichia sorbitophila (strain ATCC MYA-4447 / BCRC 22081 / CBS 7064 / NBRC 10061 / NRRL Y-12695) TaxID=559304 RepID=G8Y0T6_PICSO|nr:Piso0_004929 [Millerozyma farinosa CBS 7064]